jgi:hypothetical protein
VGSSTATGSLRRLHRMQHAQASVDRWKRRARFGAVGTGLAAITAAVVLTVPMLDRDGAMASAVASAVADPGAILSARSPGGRTPGALTQTKKRKKLANTRLPRLPAERVLSGGRTRPGAGLPDAPLAYGPSAFDGLPVAPIVLADNLAPLPTIPGVPVIGLEPGGGAGPGGPGGIPGGGGGVIGDPGDEDGGGDNPPAPPTTPGGGGEVPAVPEPSTWATFILGFFLAGGALRRRRKERAAPQAR